ncbi:MAG TPA: ATP-binding protein [Blastocatellia bacterium]|nr:ATP-binding protein [Blastocatellia bacterium]
MSAPNSQSLQSSNGGAKRRIGRRWIRIIILGLATTLVFGLIFVQAAFDTLPWLRPSSVSETFSLYVLSTINFLAFLVLLMALVRNIIKLRRERSEKKIGARFKTRLVVFFIALSLLPVTFLFFATSGLINRSMDKWFGLPGNQILDNAIYMKYSYVEGESEGLGRIASTLSRLMGYLEDDQLAATLASEVETQQLMLAQLYNMNGELIAQKARVDPKRLGDKYREALEAARLSAVEGKKFADKWIDEDDQTIQLVSAVPVETGRGGALVIARQLAQKFADRVNNIQELEKRYQSLKDRQKRFKNTALLTLALITLLVLFIAFWLALHVARSIADPVQQMAEATERIKKGDLSYRAEVVGDDELAGLALSFNEMMAEVAQNRRQIEQAAEELQQSNAALDERRLYIEAILESLSAGVISIDEHLHIKTINKAALKLLNFDQPAVGVALDSLLPADQRGELRKMVLRAARLRSVTREIHFTFINGTKLEASMTVTALQAPQGQSSGAVIVFEDLTELVEAQRRAAWSEVARRMAHEIKNPLTPIRLSAERLAKNLLKKVNGSNGSRQELSPRQTELVEECTNMIGAEVTTLQRMVDEFSNFARLPNAKLEICSLNDVVENTLKLYDDRLTGMRLEGDLDPDVSPILIDREQIKRVLVNLIDNAVESLADVSDKEKGEGNGAEHRITVSTRELAEQDLVELVVADNGPGIPPEDCERIFDPYFSTRKRGTGLGLAIVSHIVIEHQGRIRMQENAPQGARFIVELPNAKTIDS